MKEHEHIAKRVVDEVINTVSTPYIFSQHNFKINMPLFFGAVANTLKSDKSMSVIYYILKNLDKEGTVVVHTKFITERGQISRQLYKRTIDAVIGSGLIKRIETTDYGRGYNKYIVNPYMIYNFRKTKLKQYQENCNIWNLYI